MLPVHQAIAVLRVALELEVRISIHNDDSVNDND